MDFRTEQRILKLISERKQVTGRDLYYALKGVGVVQLKKTLRSLEKIGELEKVGERYRIAA